MHARITTARVKDGVSLQDATRAWETKAAPLIKQVQGVHAVYSMGNIDTRDALTIVVYDDKAAADAFIHGPLREQILSALAEIVGDMSVQEYETVFDLRT